MREVGFTLGWIARAILMMQFIIAGRVCFSYSHKSRYFSLFAACFISAAMLSLWLSLPSNAAVPYGQACAWVLVGMSQWIFASALMVTRKQPLTAFLSHDAPEHLLQRGPYRFIRHPLYVAYILNFVANFASAPKLITLVIAVLMGGLFVWGARLEEKKFDHGPMAEAYAAYRQRTGAVIPCWSKQRRR